MKDLIVEIGGVSHTLRPTLKALRAINSHFGDMTDAMRQCQALNFEAISIVLAAGSDVRGSAVEVLNEAIFDDGFMNHAETAGRFIGALLNPNDEEPDTEDDEGKA